MAKHPTNPALSKTEGNLPRFAISRTSGDEIYLRKNLILLYLGSNMLQGSLVVSPPTIEYFFISENKLSGSVHYPLFCNLSYIQVLDVSNNHISGMI